MNEIEIRVRVLLTMQSALLGAITPEMRAVYVCWDSASIAVRMILNRHPTPSDFELAKIIESEVVSHMPDFDVTCVLCEESNPASVRPLQGEVAVFRCSD
jgi:hypothetical protein